MIQSGAKKRILSAFLTLLLLSLLIFIASPIQANTVIEANSKLSDLKQGAVTNGFRSDALYLDADDKPVGARFKHMHTGFTFDYLQIQSVPQAFIWVNTVAESDRGEPHTQEHLLLGKGNKGRAVATLGDLSLVESSAMTMKWRTCYHFNTTAETDVFFKQLELRLDAMLNPDYTDLEIEREVRNFGVAEDPKTKKLTLEEKGTVYNEMIGYVKAPIWPLWTAQMKAIYGAGHPLTYESGGTPEMLRELSPSQIREFHKAKYKLSNMGMIGVFPKALPLPVILKKMNRILSGIQKEPADLSLVNQSDIPLFPAPQPAKAGMIQIIPYAESNKQKSQTVDFAWTASLDLDSREHLLLDLFLTSFAGDASTPLYKKLVDGKSAVLKIGATGVYASSTDEQGTPIMIGATDVASQYLNAADIEKLRDLIISELKRISELKADSPELAKFNKQVESRVDQVKNRSQEFLDTPPSFGVRRTSAAWMEHLNRLALGGKYERSLTMKDDLGFVEEKLALKENIWRDYLKKWNLLDQIPMAVTLRPDPGLIEKDEAETRKRIKDETERLKTRYQTEDEQEALRKFRADYDRDTMQLEALSKAVLDARFTDHPPMTKDDQLEYRVWTMADRVPVLSTRFDTMSAASTSLFLRIDSIPERDLPYLALFPALLTKVGVIENGKAVSYDECLDRWREEIGGVSAGYVSDLYQGRYEFEITGSGNTPAKSLKAIYWMGLLLEHPNWTVENLPRIRDCVQHSLSSMRKVRESGYEENWVNGTVQAYWRQAVPLMLHTHSFLTQTHDIQRLRWQLKGDISEDNIRAFVGFLTRIQIDEKADGKLALIGKNPKRSELISLLNALQKHSDTGLTASFKAAYDDFTALAPTVSALVLDAADDLLQDLPDIPDSSLKSDWNEICTQISQDIQVQPSATLAKLDSIRKLLLTTGAARVNLVGSSSTQTRLEPAISELIERLEKKPFVVQKYSDTPLILERLRQRNALEAEKKPIFLGLINEKSTQGVIMNGAPAIKYTDLDEESLLRFLAFQIFAGGGGHSVYMKTWGAGLAYGNGVRGDVHSMIAYYADKCPSIPETIKFVIKELKEGSKHPDPALAEYALAQVFSSRAAGTYKSRAFSMGEDLASNKTPETVRKFREAILKLRKDPKFTEKLYARMFSEYGKVLPGMGVKCSEVPDGIYFVIGDENQMQSYDTYLKTVEGPDTKLYRIYARDYWI